MWKANNNRTSHSAQVHLKTFFYSSVNCQCHISIYHAFVSIKLMLFIGFTGTCSCLALQWKLNLCSSHQWAADVEAILPRGQRVCCEEAEGATNIWYVKPVVYHRAVRRIENIGASRFGMYGSGFGSKIPDLGSVRTLHCAFKTTMVEVEK